MTVHCQRAGCGKSWPRDPVLEVDCPSCEAKVGQRCRRPSGHMVWGGGPHATRDRLAFSLGHYRGACPLGICGSKLQAVDEGSARC